MPFLSSSPDCVGLSSCATLSWQHAQSIMLEIQLVNFSCSRLKGVDSCCNLCSITLECSLSMLEEDAVESFLDKFGRDTFKLALDLVVMTLSSIRTSFVGVNTNVCNAEFSAPRLGLAGNNVGAKCALRYAMKMSYELAWSKLNSIYWVEVRRKMRYIAFMRVGGGGDLAADLGVEAVGDTAPLDAERPAFDATSLAGLL